MKAHSILSLLNALQDSGPERGSFMMFYDLGPYWWQSRQALWERDLDVVLSELDRMDEEEEHLQNSHRATDRYDIHRETETKRNIYLQYTCKIV